MFRSKVSCVSVLVLLVIFSVAPIGLADEPVVDEPVIFERSYRISLPLICWHCPELEEELDTGGVIQNLIADQDMGLHLNQWWAQSFWITESHHITSIKLRIRKGSELTRWGVTVALCSDDNGLPGPPLAIRTLGYGSFTTAYRWTEFVLPNLISMPAPTRYWILVTSDAMSMAHGYGVEVAMSNPYPGGIAALYVWPWPWQQDRGTDLAFQVYYQ